LGYAAKIGAVTDAARPLALGAGRAGRRLRLQDDPFVLSAIHLDEDGIAEPQVLHARLLLDHRLGRKPVPVDEPVAQLRVHGEVAGVVGGQVLEEVSPLRGGDPEVLEAGLDDDPRAGDLVPGDRNSEEGIRRPPPPHPEKDIGNLAARQGGVELGHLGCGHTAAGAVEAVVIDDDEVAHALDAAVAEDGRALADQVLALHVPDLQLDQLA